MTKSVVQTETRTWVAHHDTDSKVTLPTEQTGKHVVFFNQ